MEPTDYMPGLNLRIPKPPIEALNNWLERINFCNEYNITTDMVLQAYYFECAFYIGQSGHNNLLNNIAHPFRFKNGKFEISILSTSSSDLLLDAVCYMALGMRHPRYGDPKEFHDEFEKKAIETGFYIPKPEVKRPRKKKIQITQ